MIAHEEVPEGENEKRQNLGHVCDAGLSPSLVPPSLPPSLELSYGDRGEIRNPAPPSLPPSLPAHHIIAHEEVPEGGK